MVSNALFSSKTDEWTTPQHLFEELNREFKFEVDVCANKENAKCEKFFCIEDNSLDRDWAPMVCWMNPPYSQIAKWMAKADLESKAGATVVCLVPSRTDTKWFHESAIHHEIRFIKGRLKFGSARNSAPFPSMIVVMKPKK
jgi:site-specific DNA-methyltransferase (adenine-specific)